MDTSVPLLMENVTSQGCFMEMSSDIRGHLAKLLPRTYTRDRVQLVANVKTKDIICAESSSLQEPNCYLVIEVC